MRNHLVALALAACSLAAAAASQEPVHVALLVDTSGSIQPRDRAVRNALAAEIAAQLGAGSEVAVYTFDDQPKLILPRTTDTAKVAAAVSQLGAAGRFTALNDAIYDAARYLAEGPAGKRAIVVVTDGLDENSALVPEDGINEARERRIPIFTAGVGNVQERYLRRIAKLSGGEYFPPRSAANGIAERVAQLTPISQPRSAAAPASTPAAAAAVAAPSRPVVAEPAPVIATWPLLAGVGLAVAIALSALGFVLLRKPEAPASLPAGAGRTGSLPVFDDDPEPEDITLVGKLEGLESEEHTLLLTRKPLLHITKGPNVGRFYEVRRESATSIGRVKGNDIVLDDISVSSQHCRIRPHAGAYELIDLKSTNGTYVNERRVGRCVLSAGDVLKIGETALQFRMDHTKGPTPSPVTEKSPALLTEKGPALRTEHTAPLKPVP